MIETFYANVSTRPQEISRENKGETVRRTLHRKLVIITIYDETES